MLFELPALHYIKEYAHYLVFYLRRLRSGLDKRMRLWDIGKKVDTRQYFVNTRNIKREGWELHVSLFVENETFSLNDFFCTKAVHPYLVHT